MPTSPLGSVLVVTAKAAAIWMESAILAVSGVGELESDAAVTANDWLPAVVGVPVISPLVVVD